MVTDPCFYKYLLGFGCANVSLEESIRYNQFEVPQAYWRGTMLKLFDLLDTVFFVLRKKQGHVTFLHVRHHVATAVILWILTKYFLSEYGYFFFTYNI